MPKINGNEIRPGNVLEHNGGLWAAVKVDHVKPGKGGAFAQVEMRNLRNGSKLNERFRSADKVEKVRLEQKDQQFLYEDAGMLVLMDTETYEQVQLSAELLGERRPFLQDGMMVVVEYHEEEALNASLPQKVTCKIVETEHLDTLADGVAGGVDADSLTLPMASEVIDEIVHCDEDQIAAALKVLAWDENMLVEGAAALALAAYLADPEKYAGQTSAVLLCGGNYEVEQLRGII